ncbi:MAG: N-acetylneuraminate synthase [Candidatus Lokiarchaeota archaeon]|nr:N-acetylneuraminate synthase [Candidatus Lokiarchaeota archaeon]
MSIHIGNRKIAYDSPCFIIAEAGVNHNGDIGIAKKLIDVAAQAKADAVKFQTFKTENLMTRNLEKADYQKIGEDDTETFFDLAKRLEFSFEVFLELKNYAESKNIMFLSTPFSAEAALFLNKIQILAFKVSSGDIDNFPFLEHLIQYGKPILLSTGTAYFQEVQEVAEFFAKHNFKDLVLLQCTTSYPTPLKNIHLRVLTSFQKNFPNYVIGFSDHSQSTTLGSAARAMGALVIEKHFTLDKRLEGPDHQASLNPHELQQYIQNIRDIEIALGNPTKMIQDVESQNKITTRKSIVSKCDLKKGNRIDANCITIKRPGNGIRPKFFKTLIGKKINKDIKKDEVLHMKDIEWGN